MVLASEGRGVPTEHERTLRSVAVRLVSTCDTSSVRVFDLTSPPQSSDFPDPVRSFVLRRCVGAVQVTSFQFGGRANFASYGENLGCLFASAVLPHYDS